MQRLREEKDEVEAEIDRVAYTAAKDLGLELNKSIKLEWHKCVGGGQVWKKEG